MKRLATLVLAASFSIGSLVTMGQGALATPFSDVPANHWAYQAIQSLAADGLVEGYPDGKFKGDRPLSRYEMAVLVARVIAKVQANGAGYASKADLDKLQKLIDALKDELDSLGVRVTNVEDALAALDKRTKFAQSIQLHGALFHNLTMRQNVVYPHTITNTTGAAQTLYYGGSAPSGNVLTIDPFTEAFMRSDESNNPIGPANSGDQIRYDDRLSFSYAITDNLTVSIPVHLVNYDYGSDFQSNSLIGIQPDILVNVAKAGNLTNFYMRFGTLDNLKSSRTGLTYRAPDASQQGPGFEYPFQPYQRGVEFGGVLNGLTEFQASFSRMDQTYLNTLSNVLAPTGEEFINGYLFPEVRPQTTTTQTGAPGSLTGSLKAQTANAGTEPLSQVYLNSTAVAGTVYISAYDGSLFNSAGQLVGGTGGPAAPPGFVFNSGYNLVYFTTPLPAGSTVTITYVGLGASSNSNWERYAVTARINQKFKGYAGAEVGLTFNRIFDFSDTYVYGNGGAAQNTLVKQAAATGYGLVSNSVLGLDFQAPLPFTIIDKTQKPVLFGEAAASKYTPDYTNQSAVTDTAGIIGLRLKFYDATASIQYQAVGANFFDGAPLRFFGNAPQLYSFNRLPYLPGFFGFGNNLGINQQFDSFAGTHTAGNPNLTYIYPMFNPFVASGPSYFSAFAPNTQGLSGNITAPIRIGDLKFNARLAASRLQEILPDSQDSNLYSVYTGLPGFVSKVRETFDRVEGGAQFSVPVFQQKLGINLTGSLERLSRPDNTVFGGAGVGPLGVGAGVGYVPFNPGTQSVDPASAAAAAAAAAANGGNTVPFYANYTNVYHTTAAAAATLPVTKDVVFGASYNSQAYHGANGTTQSQNIAERKDTYLTTLTYNIPKTTSAVTFAYRNLKYTDYVVPSFNMNVNKEDVNFVIRF
jgi:hypothetical protein